LTLTSAGDGKASGMPVIKASGMPPAYASGIDIHIYMCVYTYV
jgi:hypothetical protein